MKLYLICVEASITLYQKNRDETISFIFYGMNDLQAQRNLGFQKTVMWIITSQLNYQ